MAGKLINIARQRFSSSFRLVHTSTRICGIFDFLKRPVARSEDFATGYQKIIMEARKVGDDPLNVDNLEQEKALVGSGTKSDPFLIPSRNSRRYVLIEGPDYNGGPLTGFWVTLENGGRCPFTAQYYKLDYQPEDQWGIDELDLFKH